MSEPDPLFEKGIHRYRTGMIEFRAFLEGWEPIYRRFCDSSILFQQLSRAYPVSADARHPLTMAMIESPREVVVSMPPTLQVKFYRREYGEGRLTHDLKTAYETGATLVYSPAGDGAVGVFLYPAGGDLAEASEAILIVRHGYFTAHQLRQFLTTDLGRLVDYAIVTTIDGSPTLHQKLRVWWLRRTCIRIGREAKTPQLNGFRLGDMATLTASTIVKSAIVAGFKPVGYLVAFVLILALTSWGFFEWAGIQRVPDVYQFNR